mgnify:CR=1 FL=1
MNDIDCGIDSNRPLSCGADHTVRLWRVQEESHLVYRGQKSIVDTISVLTGDSFVSGDENGSICVWKMTQKRPSAEITRAHGTYSDMSVCSNISGTTNNNTNNTPNTPNKPNTNANNRWISSLSAIRMSDTFASGSSDGYVRLWSVDMNKNRHEMCKCISKIATPGFVNGLILTPNLLVAGTGREHKLGRWWCLPGNKNKVCITKLPRLDVLEEIEEESDCDSEIDSMSDSD